MLLGKQGAGKGTQCTRLSRHYVVPHISTGDMFRAAIKSRSELGDKVRKYIDEGDLIPDEIVLEAVVERLDQDDTKARGFVLDGFPRTAQQAKSLARILDPDPVDLVIDLEVPTEVVLRRLAARRVCSDCGANYSTEDPPKFDWTCDSCGGEVIQREDDTQEAIRHRLDLYERRTAPLIAWYQDRDRLVKVSGMGHPDKVTARLVKVIDKRREAGGRQSRR